MENKEFIEKLVEYRLMDSVWRHVMKYVVEPIYCADDDLKLLSLYFVYISSGSSCMPLDSDILKEEWISKCQATEVLLTSATEDTDKISEIEREISELMQCGLEAIPKTGILEGIPSLVGPDRLFIIDGGFLFARQYFEAKNSIRDKVLDLFVNFTDSEAENSVLPDVKDIWKSVSDAQKEIVVQGFSRNLVVTGGPGTGKTTAVFYLLLMLMGIHDKYKIYITAPSGKAASRINESIAGEIENFHKINGTATIYEPRIERLGKLEEYTIHRLLGTDFRSGGFVHTKDNPFDAESIFVIDEASMIDVSVFRSLLEAIPKGARVFILGDKYQLPSVECGAVLSDLLGCKELKNNKVELEESHRFVEGSDIYELAQKVNSGITVSDIAWENPDALTDIITKTDVKKTAGADKKKMFPVYYYNDDLSLNPKDAFKSMLEKWADCYYKDNLKISSGIPFCLDSLDHVYETMDTARVLSAENEGRRGVSTINSIIKSRVIPSGTQTKIRGYYPGMPVMITENNKALELYNGDTGILVTFEGSDVLFLLIKKKSEHYKNDAVSVQDKVFKLGEYMLYPLRMLDLKKVIYAYAITIHKSQGSGYDNIMVVLPKRKGHPLLNRQILYTAITRTKGPTYLISDTDRVNEAIAINMKRYTRIFE